MNLVDIDMVGLKPPQRIFDFLQDSRPADIAEHSSARPFKSRFGRNEHARAEMPLADRPADDFLGTAEAIGRSGIDEIEPWSIAARIVTIDSVSSVPPHI